MTSRHFGVLGAGRQGTAAAYDLAVHQQAERLTMLDANLTSARQAASRINRLAGREVAMACQLDASQPEALVAALRPLDVVVCALPYALIPATTRAAIAAGTGMVDLGGHTQTVLEQLARHPEAQAAGIAVVPDCGMGPGLNNSLAMYLLERMRDVGAEPVSVRLFDGGLPQDRSVSWGYRSTFHIEGLTNEYDGEALFLRGGRVASVPALSEPEVVEFDELGPLEAFVTSGGTSTVPYSLEGELQTYENKTLRYPGHLAAFHAFRELGLFARAPIAVDGTSVSPRAVYHALLGPQIGAETVMDVCVMRAVGTGRRGSEEVGLTLDIVDRYDAATGFSAMERLTGWHAAIMAGFIGDGTVGPGVHSLENAMPAKTFVDQVRRRGIAITERWTT